MRFRFVLFAFLTLFITHNSIPHPAITTTDCDGTGYCFQSSSDYSPGDVYPDDHPSVWTNTRVNTRATNNNPCTEWTADAWGSVTATSRLNSAGQLISPHGYYTLVCRVYKHVPAYNAPETDIAFGHNGIEKDVAYDGLIHRWGTTFEVTITYCDDHRLSGESNAKIDNRTTMSSQHGGGESAECSASYT